MKSNLVEIRVTGISKNGNGSATIQHDQCELKCEIPFTLPGDLVKAEIAHTKDGLATATLKEIVAASPLRIAARCQHFTICGGCRFQHIPYQEQLLHKEKLVRDCFAALIGKDVQVHPIIPCETLWGYRNKMDYTFSYNENGAYHLGHIQDGSKGCVVNIEECHLSPPWFVDALAVIRQWWEMSKMRPYDPTTNEGTLRLLTLREGRQSGDRMVILTIANSTDFELNLRHIEKFVSCLSEHMQPPQKENQLSIFLRIHQTEKGTSSSQYEMLLYGPGFIREKLKIKIQDDQEPEDLIFEIGPSAFFQPNQMQTEVLFSHALRMAGLTKESVVFDLYCGTGVLGLCASKFVKQVVGIELSPEAADNARTNVRLNECSNMSIYSGAVRHVLNEFKRNCAPQPDIVIINPPRSGLDPMAMQLLMQLKAQTLLYVSCMPETQAKNIEFLTKNGYRLTAIQPIDQFPHTNHVENVTLLERI